MDRHTKYHGKILKFLPKAASVMNLPFSPNKDKRYSGAIVPMMIPHEARIRRKSKDDEDSINNREPTSPKISCMGQIKLKNKNKTKRLTRDPHAHKQAASSSTSSGIRKMFSFNNNKPAAAGRKSSASASSTPSGADQSLIDSSAPALSQMRRFASGRDHRMASFDWTATQVAPVDAEHRNEAGYHGDVIIPFSAPLGNNNEIDVPLQPRKEINLWKRRTLTPPRPLDLNTMMIRAN